MVIRKKKLLLISYFFPPINNIAARRWASMIREIETDFEVFVFSAGVENVTDEEEGTNIFRFGSISNYVEKVEENKRGILHTLISRHFTHQIRSFDHTYKSWYLKYRKQMDVLFQEIRPDVLLTTFGPIGPSLLGKFFKRKYPSIFWVADLRDSVSILNEDQKNLFQRLIDSRLDKIIHSEADLICTVSNTLSGLLSDFYKKKVFTLYNGFEGNAISMLPESARNQSITAYYAGYIYEHRKESFILAAKAFKSLKIRFKVRLLCSPDEWKEMNQIIEKFSLDTVELYRPAPSKIIYQEELEADILVILEDLDKSSMVTKGNLTGKLFEYLKFPAPILAVCRTDSEIKNILVETKRGILVDSFEDIINSIGKLRDYKLECISQISTYSRKFQAKSFLNKLNQCL